MKKYCSFLLVLSFILQSMVVAFAGSEGWTVTLNGTVNTNPENYFAKLSTEAGVDFKYSGENSLYMKYPGTTKAESEYMEVKNTLSSPTEQGASYTLKFYIKGSRNSDYQEAVLGNTVIVDFKNISKTSSSAPSGQTGWYEYVHTFTAAAAEQSFSFRFYGGTNSAAIDDVSLVKEGTEDNLIVNGDFENALAEEEEVEEEFDQTPYMPVNIIASANQSSIILNWRNPSASTLSKISVYDITGGKNELLSNSVNTTKSKLTYYQITGLTEGETYQYKVIFNFSDKGDFVYYLTGTPSSKTTVKNGSWDLMKAMSGTAGYCPGELALDIETARTGDSSLRMRCNIDRTVTELKNNIYLAATLPSKMEVGKTYQVSFWIKGEEVDTAPAITMQWIEFDDHVRAFSELKGTYDWQEVKVLYTYKERNTFYFVYDGYCKNIWLDDLEIYEVDEEGKIVEGAENLAIEGGFEEIAGNKVAEISKLNATPTPGGLDLEWKISDESCKEIEIYEKYYDKYLYRGTIVKDSKISLTNLIQGKEYTFSLVPVNTDNVRGTPVEVTGITIMPEYEIGDVVLKYNKEVVENLSGAGEYTVTFSVKNNVFEDGMSVEQFVAVFDENNVLYDIVSTKKTISKTGRGKPYTNITTTFTIPDDNYTAEYFVFDDRATMNIIGEPNPHKVYTKKN